ncbi:transporter substrate-binding domain-containing protein [Pseudomonas sp. N040]|uniref:transporter substrate-binding domain-containing protein n=1 Tax=Pseudomonas sp. N040 TaxID=2785325 RepID=UPI0018A2B4F5|nr:transporter substrate-binding domain-containing protein [Pseudomonas sp. N040]MBF7731538.1 transporter substrate-binding domain-containing protein [Pseudomonas sp. N040]MBW7015182.1 transporter substrate-binding domain-containing protein [Pseudomonas sp. N040]
MLLHICLAGGLLVSGHLPAQPYPTVTLHYSERQPYQYTDGDGRAAGVLITPTARVFARAGVPVTWKSEPFNRSLMVIQANTGNDCSIGWFKTPEREGFARFSLPIYRDQPQVGLVRADFPVQQGVSARELLGNPEIRLLLKQSFAYGEYLDSLIARLPAARVQRVSVEVPNLLLMLQARRADLLILAAEEVDFYAAQAGQPLQGFRVVRLADLPRGELRYLMCSQQVPEAIIRRLDAAIRREVTLDEPAAVNQD